MKILHLTTHLEMGGIPIYVLNLCRGLKREGHLPMVVSSGGALEKRFTEEGVPHFQVPCRTSSEVSPTLWLRAFPRLLGIVRRERPDMLHAHTRVTQVLAWALHCSTGIPYVTTCHGLYRFRFGRRFFHCWGSAVMAISTPSMERLVHDYKLAEPHQAVLVRNGIEVDHFLRPVPPEQVAAFRQQHGLNGEPVIGAVARLSPVKGFDFLLRAVPDLLKKFPRLQVLLVGSGPAREDLVRLAYELKIADHVVIAHPVDDTRIPLAAMQIFVTASLREGFGLALVEAMAAGVPVVATDSGGPAEIIEPGKSGLLVPPGESGKLGQAIGRLLSDPVLWARMAEVDRQRARSQFDLKRVVREVEAVYTEFARNGSS